MATTLKQPTDRRGVAKLTASLDRLSRRERIAALTLAVLLALLLAVGVGSAIGGGLPFGDEEEARGASGLPSNWANLEPLLPLAPSLKDIAALKRSAAGEASGVLAAESGGGALRLRALPEGSGAASGDGARDARGRASSGRPEPAVLRAPAVLQAPRILRVPSVRRILVTRLTAVLGATNELLQIIENDLRNLPGLPIDLDVDLPPINPLPGFPIPSIDPPPLPGGNPLPGGGSLPAIPGGGVPLNVTVVNSQADSSFDVLLISRGRRLVEAYRFRDQDIAGLAAQINLRSSVLVADLLRDGGRLAQVTAAPLRSTDSAATLRSPDTAASLRSADTAGSGSGSAAAGLAAGASRSGGGESGGGSGSRSASAESRVQDRPPARTRERRGLGGGSAAGRESSPRRTSSPGSSSRSGGATAPRRAQSGRSSTSPPPSPRPRGRSSAPRGGHSGERSHKPRKVKVKKPKEHGRSQGHGGGGGGRRGDD